MANAEADLEGRARRAYERGRLLAGLRRAAIVLPMVAVSLLACNRPAATSIVAVALIVVIVAAEWRGIPWSHGARLGLGAGLVPLIAPVVMGASGHVCHASLCLLYPGVCLASGGAAGALLARWVVPRGLDARLVATAGLAAALVGGLGCLIAGFTGLVGLSLGLAAGAAPVLIARRA
jgi:hypothetical protein